MPIFRLSQELIFPPVELAEDDGLLAVEGDLTPDRLILAYENGIFPWYSEGEPILWWSPDPRFVLFPAELHISKSLKKALNQNPFKITYDQAFSEVMKNCGQRQRPNQDGTWITPAMLEAYSNLHLMGLAHSVEAWNEGRLVGGLYGVSLGKCFYGESMFYLEENASKIAFVHLVKKLHNAGYQLIDCQVYTPYLESFGARLIPRKEFCDRLYEALALETRQGNWGEWE